MLRPFGLIYHVLQGDVVYGVRRIDVASVIQMKYRERLFMIRDRNKLYTLSILHYELPENIKSSNHTTELIRGTTLRYPSELSAAFEMYEIQNKQKALNDYAVRLREEIRKDQENN